MQKQTSRVNVGEIADADLMNEEWQKKKNNASVCRQRCSGFFAGIIGGIITLIAAGAFLLWAPQSDWVISHLGLTNPATQSAVSQILAVQEESATIDVVNTVKSSVVSISISKEVSQQPYYQFGPTPYDEFLQEDGTTPESQQVEVGGGTGFIISADGLILTNRHVVSEEDATYTVITDNGKEYPAKILGRDSFNDIAVVKIEAAGLPVVELGDSDSLQQGQTVIAIGNTLAVYQNTVTKGIVSGLSRTLGDGALTELIQTDAAINQGNSGGPLVNLDGQVVGINTAVDRGGEGIGFAIPINEARVVIDSVRLHGRIVRPYIGVRYVMIDEEFQELNDLAYNYGALIRRSSNNPDALAVIPGSPADTAGLEENDIILEVEGKKVEGGGGLPKVLEQFSVGQTVQLKVYHNGNEENRSLTLIERPADE